MKPEDAIALLSIYGVAFGLALLIVMLLPYLMLAAGLAVMALIICVLVRD